MIVRRMFAFFIDLVIATVISYIPPGFILAFIFMLLRDRLTKQGSPGKNLLNLQVTTIMGQQITWEESIRRNVILALPLLFNILPLVGAVITMIAYFIICLVEIFTIIGSANGQRFGERWANTIIREAPDYYHKF